MLDGRRLHEALVYALAPGSGESAAKRLDVDGPPTTRATTGDIGDPLATPLDWYEHHPQHNDGGYLSHLLEQCRTAFAGLPSHELVAAESARRRRRIVAFQSLNLSESQGDHAGLERGRGRPLRRERNCAGGRPPPLPGPRWACTR